MNDVTSLSNYSNKRNIDFAGLLVRGENGEAVINFGKHKGKTAREVYQSEKSYFNWIQSSSFMLDSKKQFAKLAEEFAMENGLKNLSLKWGK